MHCMGKSEAISNNKRNSSIELLRLILMLMIMIGHAIFRGVSMPSGNDIISTPLLSMLVCYIAAISVVAVNAFVFLSGWFLIKPTLKKLFQLLFQALFLVIIVYFLLFAIGIKTSFNRHLLIDTFFLKPYWFIQSYLVLFALSPVLNYFIQSANKKEYIILLVMFYIMELIYGWLPFSSNDGWFDSGYSPLHFFFMYLLAGFIKRHIDYNRKTFRWFISFFLVVSIVITLVTVIGRAYFPLLSWGIFFYSSPLVVLSSVLLCLAFIQFRLKNRYINKIAISAMAIYIVHCHPIIWEMFLRYIRLWHENNSPSSCLSKTVVLIGSLFIVSIFLDRIRLIFWSLIDKKIKK